MILYLRLILHNIKQKSIYSLLRLMKYDISIFVYLLWLGTYLLFISKNNPIRENNVAQISPFNNERYKWSYSDKFIPSIKLSFFTSSHQAGLEKNKFTGIKMRKTIPIYGKRNAIL